MQQEKKEKGKNDDIPLEKKIKKKGGYGVFGMGIEISCNFFKGGPGKR